MLVLDFSCRLIRGAGSHTRLKRDSFCLTCSFIPGKFPTCSNIFLHTHHISCTDPYISHTLLHTEASVLPLISIHTPSEWKRETRTPPARVRLPPRATPCLARSSQTGSTTLRPRAPLRPQLVHAPPPNSIHHICPPASIASPQRQLPQRKEKAKKDGRRIQPLPCRTVLAWGPSFVPGPASPRLVSPANTPSSLGEQRPGGLGDGTGVWFYLKQHSKAPSMAPWSPADPVCWAVKQGHPWPSPCIHRHSLWGAVGTLNSWLRGPQVRGSPWSADLTTEALWSGTVKLRWGGGLSAHLQGAFTEKWLKWRIYIGSKTPLTFVWDVHSTVLMPDHRFDFWWHREGRKREKKTRPKNKRSSDWGGERLSEWAASITCKQKLVPFCWCWCSVAGHPAFVAQGREGSPRLVTFTPSADRAPLTAGHGCYKALQLYGHKWRWWRGNAHTKRVMYSVKDGFKARMENEKNTGHPWFPTGIHMKG